ncbi:putative glutamyl-trna synthetase [Phaeomoniella chlamydospora]|uniref:Glutamate--tRNA ligase, mitochondrial n=1 Tax=Phaeomoniella chlamydospora TaxID=158046 RepID=A0A0G2F041_PHACM|nr:putative glutamyl-trna synthetase [Phaeomoniella chlamydospora]
MRLPSLSRWTCSQVHAEYNRLRIGYTIQRRSASRNACQLSRPARTRFAPSPTGNLHLGSIRTALFNYLIARKTGGQFLLRIEDTDQKRTVPGAENRLFDDLQWAGITWDEGPVVGGPFGPYRQSERTQIYEEHSDELVRSGAAYRCFCSAERLDNLARSRNSRGLAPGYDRKCYDISQDESDSRAHSGEKFVVRLRAPEDYPQFFDLVYRKTGRGPKNKASLYSDDAAYDDPILMKSDGYPTYHFANVVDDHLMQITHVIRGSEWMASTPLHVAIYQAFGWEPPNFAHVPLLVDAQGQKLSKRDKASDISFYRSIEGVFPDTLVNFAALLGWSHQRKSDVMTLKDLEKEFSFKFTKGNAIVAFEKLWFLQQRHALRVVEESGQQFFHMVDDVHTVAVKTYSSSDFASQSLSHQKNQIKLLLRADGKNFSNARTFVQRNSNFFQSLPNLPPYELLDQSIPLPALRTAAATLTFVPASEWTTANHFANISAHAGIVSFTNPDPSTEPSDVSSALKIWRKEFYHYMRWALLAGAPGPGIADTMTILGRDESVRRIQQAIATTIHHEQEQKTTKEGKAIKVEPYRVIDWKDVS